ncbi:MAG TPA: response regulator, partial [Marmoricola sp.]|nr:response regulator [Marmoricola sp.]
MPIRVVAVDDHPVVAEGVLALAERANSQLQALGTAATVADLMTMLDSLAQPPDVVLLDLHLEDGSASPDTISALTERGIRVVLLTSELRPIPIRAAMRAGAVGLCLKSDDPAEIVRVVLSAADGDSAVSSDLAFVLMTDQDLTARLA